MLTNMFFSDNYDFKCIAKIPTQKLNQDSICKKVFFKLPNFLLNSCAYEKEIDVIGL